MLARLARIGLAAAFLALIGSNSVVAGDICRNASCPKCETCCELKVEEGTEEKHCWKTEKKTVCIPKVTFSWQWPFQKKKSQQNCDASCNKPCCEPPKLAKTRKVCTLVKETFECPVCKYKWGPKESTPCTVCTETELPIFGAVAPQPTSASQQALKVQQPAPAIQPVKGQQPAPIVSSRVARGETAATEAAKPVSRPVVLRLSN
ncbi:MAG: hypothetical protein ACE361_17770 [Aureliella sp.]